MEEMPEPRAQILQQDLLHFSQYRRRTGEAGLPLLEFRERSGS